MSTYVQEKEIGRSQLFVKMNGGKFLLANCNPIIEVRACEKTLTLKNRNIKYTVKSVNTAIVICADMEFTQKPSIEMLEGISSFDLRFDYIRQNGDKYIKELTDIIPLNIDLNGKWEFDITGYLPEIRELFPELRFE